MSGIGGADLIVLLLIAAVTLAVLTAAVYGTVLLCRRLFKRTVT